MNQANINQEHMVERLWEYIDGNSQPETQTVISRLIEEKQQWREKYHELLEIHQMLQASELEEPSLRFTKNVMEKIASQQISPATRSYINYRVIWGITIFFFALIGGMLIYGFGQIDWAVSSSNYNLPVDLERVDYSALFNNTYINIFMMLNVVLGLMFLDKALTNKRKRDIGNIA
jgi:regulatory protein YycI of two-component signal transduction system YycFG